MLARGRVLEREHRERAWQAWQTASLSAYAYHAPKKMPGLETLLGAKPKPQLQTPDEMRAAFAAWRASAKS